MSKQDNSNGKREGKSRPSLKRNFSKPSGKPASKSSGKPETGKGKSSKSNKKAPAQEGIRLNKYIANSGVCSRRDADIYISAGSVTVNGKAVTEMGHRVRMSDDVRFDGKRLSPEKIEYFLLNKPKGFHTTTNTQKENKTVMQLMANATKSRILPVDKLDRSSTGLLLFTNDGELAKKLVHRRNFIRKMYHVQLNKTFKTGDLSMLRKGIELPEIGKIEIDEIDYVQGGKKNEVGLLLKNGRHRIVHQIFTHLEYEIDKLDRVVYGGLTKKDLPRGTYRRLTDQEVINLKMI